MARDPQPTVADAASDATGEQRRDDRGGPEQRPRQAEHGGITDRLSGHDRQEGRGDDVAEAEGAVTEGEAQPLGVPRQPRPSRCPRDWPIRVTEHRPDDAGHDQRADAEDDPGSRGRRGEAHERQTRGSGEGDAGTHAREHRAFKHRPAQRLQPLQTPRRRADEHPGARDAGERTQEEPTGERIVKSHRERRDADGDETGADRRRGRDRHEHDGQRADEIADIIRGREPRAGRDRHAGVLLHHRQDRRERETADAHRDGERRQTGAGDDPARVRWAQSRGFSSI